MPTPTPTPGPRPGYTVPTSGHIEEEEALEFEPRRKRDWGSFFKKAVAKVNESWKAAEDEEI